MTWLAIVGGVWLGSILVTVTFFAAEAVVHKYQQRHALDGCVAAFTTRDIAVLLQLVRDSVDPDELWAEGTDIDADLTDRLRLLAWRCKHLENDATVLVATGKVQLPDG